MTGTRRLLRSRRAQDALTTLEWLQCNENLCLYGLSGAEHFTGRVRKLAKLGEFAAASKSAPVIVQILGLPGIGKTGLAVHWSHQQKQTYSDGFSTPASTTQVKENR